MTTNTELKRLQREYRTAKTEHERTEKISQSSKNKILRENIFADELTGERILCHKSDFMMDDESFRTYCDLVFAETTRRGLVIPNADTTADYKTRPALRQAEENLLDFAIDRVLPKAQREDFIQVKEHYNYRDDMLKLTMQLAL